MVIVTLDVGLVGADVEQPSSKNHQSRSAKHSFEFVVLFTSTVMRMIIACDFVKLVGNFVQFTELDAERCSHL